LEDIHDDRKDAHDAIKEYKTIKGIESRNAQDDLKGFAITNKGPTE